MNKKAFTLIELLIVVVIIGILATLIVINYNGARERAKISKAKQDIAQLREAALRMILDTNQYPNHISAQDCSAPANPSGMGDQEYPIDHSRVGFVANDGLFSGWVGPYVPDGMVTDPWGHKYTFDPDYACFGSTTIDPLNPGGGSYTIVAGNDDLACLGYTTGNLRVIVSYGLLDADGPYPRYGGDNISQQICKQ